jgi:hypothetical protein
MVPKDPSRIYAYKNDISNRSNRVAIITRSTADKKTPAVDVDNYRLFRFVVVFREDIQVKRVVLGGVADVFFFESTRKRQPVGKVEIIWLRKMRCR